MLNDKVLHTLESIARGELAIGSQQVRETCMRDADYLRGLITGGADSIPTDLGVALAGMGRDRSALGLRINQQFDALPKQFPPHVTEESNVGYLLPAGHRDGQFVTLAVEATIAQRVAPAGQPGD